MTIFKEMNRTVDTFFGQIESMFNKEQIDVLIEADELIHDTSSPKPEEDNTPEKE